MREVFNHFFFFFFLISVYVTSLHQVFPGNQEAYKTKLNTFFPPLVGRFIRLHPIEWSNKATVRMEFYGCELDGELHRTHAWTRVEPDGGSKKNVPMLNLGINICGRITMTFLISHHRLLSTSGDGERAHSRQSDQRQLHSLQLVLRALETLARSPQQTGQRQRMAG